jgi:hypothetical protein
MITQTSMHKFEFKLAFFDRLELRSDGAAVDELNTLGAQGWHIVHIKDDPKRERSLAIFLEREIA